MFYSGSLQLFITYAHTLAKDLHLTVSVRPRLWHFYDLLHTSPDVPYTCSEPCQKAFRIKGVSGSIYYPQLTPRSEAKPCIFPVLPSDVTAEEFNP